MVKKKWLDKAKEIFTGTRVKITSEGHRHLGAFIGDEDLVEGFVREKVKKFGEEVQDLAKIAEFEPQAAYTAYVSVLQHKWNFLQRTVPSKGEWFSELEEKIRACLLPRLVDRAVGDIERKVLALPARNGGFGIADPREDVDENFRMSMKITASLQKEILDQKPHLREWDREKMNGVKRAEVNKKREREKAAKETLMENLRRGPGPGGGREEDPKGKQVGKKIGEWETFRRAVEVASEKGASSWLTHIPLARYGFELAKRDFHDAVCVRYGWFPKGLGKKCMCGRANDVAHAVSCKMGGFPVLVHNEIRDVLAGFMVEAGCKSVVTEDREGNIQSWK